jgi:hypothetical protein
MSSRIRRFLSAAVRSDDTGQQSGDSGSGVRLRTHLLHAYLPPVEVELTAELGGALDKLSDCRTVITHVSITISCALYCSRKGVQHLQHHLGDGHACMHLSYHGNAGTHAV